MTGFSSRKEHQMVNVIRVAVVDDHPLFREGVVHMMKSVDGIEVVAEGATAADAVRIAQERTPNVMLLDVNIAGGGIEAAQNVARVSPDTQVIMLTVSEDEEHVASALKAGVRGYILKGSNGQELVRVVQSIAGGNSYVAPNLAARLLTRRKERTSAEEDLDDLTTREAEVVAFLKRGMSNKEIARAFNCTERTVKHHMTNIMQKLNVRNRVQVALRFQQRETR
jgi:two-component system, NarL family, nitrate/nitrite response regulator NarL